MYTTAVPRTTYQARRHVATVVLVVLAIGQLYLPVFGYYESRRSSINDRMVHGPPLHLLHAHTPLLSRTASHARTQIASCIIPGCGHLSIPSECRGQWLDS